MREEVGLARGRKKVEQTGRRPSERERGLEKWGGKETRERAVDLFVSVVQRSFFSFGKTFFLQLIFSLSWCILHVFTFLPLPACLPSSPFISLHVLPSSPSIRLPLDLSDPVATRLSMASALCFSPPVVFNLCSPRMHLFKSCFTKTVLKENERV